jgi:hypothetical protein
MRELARLGFVLVGIQLALSAIQNAAWFVSEFNRERGSVVFGALSFGAIVLLVFVPGCVLAARSRAFATYLFPDQESPPSPFDLVAAGLAVLGAYLVIVGLSAGLSYAAVATMAADFPALAWGNVRSLFASLLEVVLGLSLFVYPHRALRYFGRERSA